MKTTQSGSKESEWAVVRQEARRGCTVKRTKVMWLVAMVSVVAMWAGAIGAAEEGWHLEVTPYVWFANVDGSVSVGDKTADFDANFSDLVDKVDLAGALMAIGSCERWVCFAQLDYFSLGQDFDKGPGGELSSDMTLVSGAVGYRFDGFRKGCTMDVLGGVRFLRDKNEVEVNGLGSADDTSELVDAMVMLRPSLPLSFISEKLRLNPTVAIGAGDSDLVWEVQPELQYQFTDRFAGRAGYRRLQYEFADGPADVDVGFQGLLIGLGVTL